MRIEKIVELYNRTALELEIYSNKTRKNSIDFIDFSFVSKFFYLEEGRKFWEKLEIGFSIYNIIAQ